MKFILNLFNKDTIVQYSELAYAAGIGYRDGWFTPKGANLLNQMRRDYEYSLQWNEPSHFSVWTAEFRTLGLIAELIVARNWDRQSGRCRAYTTAMP